MRRFAALSSVRDLGFALFSLVALASPVHAQSVNLALLPEAAAATVATGATSPEGPGERWVDARRVDRLEASLVELAHALGATTDELLGVAETRPGGPLGDRRVIRRLQQIEQLPRRKKEILLATIDSFLRGESAERRRAG